MHDAYTSCKGRSCIGLGPEHTGHFVQPHVAAHCGGDIYSRRKPLFSSFGEHTAVCGSSVRQAVARPRHRQSVCINNIHVAATCRPSVLGSATMRGHMWLNKVASVLGPLNQTKGRSAQFSHHVISGIPAPDGSIIGAGEKSSAVLVEEAVLYAACVSIEHHRSCKSKRKQMMKKGI